MPAEPCHICGGEGRISSVMGGSDKSCPSCHGTGRRMENEGMRDVTKTKPSHHRPTNKAGPPVKQTWPSTHSGVLLATEVRDSGASDQIKARLTAEIMEYETSHGSCTQTFIKKIRKQIRPRPA
jgi:hypothetical protein